jgi:hypothetical protein
LIFGAASKVLELTKITFPTVNKGIEHSDDNVVDDVKVEIQKLAYVCVVVQAKNSSNCVVSRHFKGKNMLLGAQLVDYVVLIGSSRCVAKELTDNVLRYQPPVDEPLVDVSSKNKCAELKLNSVLV